MPDFGTFADDLEAWAALFVIVITRLSFVVFLMPGLGEQVVSTRIRLVVLMALSTALAATGVVPAPSFAPLPHYLGLLAGEAIIGLQFGVMLRISIWILLIAGTVIAQSVGLSQFLGVALEQEAQTLMSNLLSMAGVVILLTADYHIMAVAALIDLYASVPVGDFTGISIDVVLNSLFTAFGWALLLSWPFVAVSLLYNICLGFINRALPQLMVAFVGAPFMVGAGTVLFALSIVGILMVWQGRVFQIVGWL